MKMTLQSNLACMATLILTSVGATGARADHAMTMPMPQVPGGETTFAREMRRSMEVMDRDMMAAPMTGDPDRDFASMMIPHHQGAVDMAKIQLLYGRDPVLRRLAQEIVATQNEEIAVMRRRLVALPAGAAQVNGAAQAAPALAVAGSNEPRAISSRDRVYTADQVSNTVSVVDPSANTLLGVIRLGDPVPQALGALYKGALLVHGLGFSPDHRTLAAVSIGSNSVTLIDTATNTIKGTVYVGRSPHEAFWTPDGRELWVAVRGEDYVSVIDSQSMKETRRITTANGPGMVLFSPGGQYAFVPSSFVPELCVVDVASHQVIARVKQASGFSPNLAVSSDGSEVWFTLKDTGKTQVISARPPFATLATLDTGPFSNHVALLDNARGRFAYITVGGENAVKVYTREAAPRLVATIALGDVPHGIWPSGDGSRVYVGLENGDAVQVIDTLQNRVIAKIGVGQLPQALVYVPDAVPTGDGRMNLTPPGEALRAAQLRLLPPARAQGGARNARASVVVNSLGLIDHLQIVASGLEPGREYQLWLASSPRAPFGERVALLKMKANPAGAATAQTLGPLRRAVTSLEGIPAANARRYLLLTTAEGDAPVLVQSRDLAG
jgi:YVTN family beta-propeller protein